MQHTHALQPLYSTWTYTHARTHTHTHTRTHTSTPDGYNFFFFLTPAVHMPVVSMCAWVSTFFCCCCRGNFEYCSLTVKRVIHSLVDLPSVLALKTNNLSLDWVYSCLDSGRKTGRLKKNQASCCSFINFFFALSAQVLRAMCPLWQASGSDIVTHTHMKNRRKRREKNGKRGWVCLI